jgi:hypothetical protein
VAKALACVLRTIEASPKKQHPQKLASDSDSRGFEPVEPAEIGILLIELRLRTSQAKAHATCRK